MKPLTTAILHQAIEINALRQAAKCRSHGPSLEIV
jgi:hypothetical protein